MNELVKSDWARQHGALTLGRTVQELVWNMDKIDIHAGKFDHQIGWVLIVAATKILEAKIPSLFSSAAELIGVHEVLKAIDPQAEDFWAPEIRFTGHDFNLILLKNLSAKDIEKIVAKLPTLIFRVNGRVSLKIDGRWKEYEVTNYDNIGGVDVVKTGKKKRGLGAGEEEQAFRIYFKSRIGLAFWHNIASGAYSLITNKNDLVKKFLAAPGSYQQLVWATWEWKNDRPAIRSEAQMFAIVGWKRAKSEYDYPRQVKALGELLKRLVRDGFLASWRLTPEGAYEMTKVGQVPPSPPSLP